MRPVLYLFTLCAPILGALTPSNVSIMQIQGRGHQSPFSGDTVVTTGVVTVVSRNGFFVQDPVGDDDPATSDGLFAFTGSTPAVDAGDWVRLEGVVTEYRPGERVIIRRNRFYGGTRPHHVDGFDVDLRATSGST